MGFRILEDMRKNYFQGYKMTNEKQDKETSIINYLGSEIHNMCHKFALNKMQSRDFILLSDANFKITEHIKMERGEGGVLYTLKNSSKEKFLDFYDKKLVDIIEKFLKSND